MTTNTEARESASEPIQTRLARLRSMLDDLIHCVRYSDRNPADGYARDEVTIARRVIIDTFSASIASSPTAPEQTPFTEPFQDTGAPLSDLVHRKQPACATLRDGVNEIRKLTATMPLPDIEFDSPAQPTMSCPKCKAVYDDHDGFGVLHCEACGYCTHASITDGVCQLCGVMHLLMLPLFHNQE